MSDVENQHDQELSPEELERQNVQELPDREVMSSIDLNPGPPPLDVPNLPPVE